MIRGEKIFTDKTRARLIAECVKKARQHEREAERQRRIARRLAAVKTQRGLDHIRLDLRVGDVDLLPYCHDTRSRCHYCTRKVHGGVAGALLSKPERFACWRKACVRAYDRDIAADERANPEVYAEAERRSKLRRQRNRRRSKVVSR